MRSIKEQINDALLAISPLAALEEELTKAIELMVATVKKGGTIYTCGNGGSACEAMHLTEELVARYSRERPGIASVHFHDAGTITCWANDYDFQSVFERQVKTFCGEKDLLVCFSTSGNSENVLLALKAARAAAVPTVSLLGRDGGKAKALSTCAITVPAKHTAHIQEAHLVVIHVLCEQLENTLF